MGNLNYKLIERAGRIDSRLTAFMESAGLNPAVNPITPHPDVTLQDVEARLSRIETRLVHFMKAAGLDPVTGRPAEDTTREMNALRHYRRENNRHVA